MIFENDTLKHSGLYHKKNAIENESIFPEIINYYGVTAFILKSLEKIKNNATCEILRNSIDNYLEEYVANIQEYHLVNSEKTNAESSLFLLYAKTAYYKTLKEKEDLQNLLNNLESRKNNTM